MPAHIKIHRKPQILHLQRTRSIANGETMTVEQLQSIVGNNEFKIDVRVYTFFSNIDIKLVWMESRLETKKECEERVAREEKNAAPEKLPAPQKHRPNRRNAK